MSAHFIQTSFNSGEWSDRLEGRVDLAKYASALYRMENFLIDPRGPAIFRPGFRFIARTKNSAVKSRLIPFQFSTTQAYILEFGQYYIRFYRNQGQILNHWAYSTYYAVGALVLGPNGNSYSCIVSHISSSFSFYLDLSAGYWALTTSEVTYEITTPYTTADVAGIKYCQSADVLYLFHKSHRPRKLSRTGHTAWILSTINFRSPAINVQGFKPVATLTLSATSGNGRTFTASTAVFLAGDVRRLITSGIGRASITAITSATQVVCDILDDFASVGPIASQSWTLEGSPSSSITPSLQSPVGAICTLTATTASFRSADLGKYIRVHNGLVKINTVASSTVVSGELLNEMTAVTATTSWTLESEAWTAANGYPSCGTFFEDRLYLALNETVWGSVVGDYENFQPGTDDSAGFEFTLAGRQVNAIHWIEPREYLILGTAGAEWRLGPEDTGKGLTPLNVVAKQQTAFGCYDMLPETVGISTLFLQRAGTKIREFTYQWESNGYVAPDLTILAEHVTKAGISGMAYQQEPYSNLWAYTVDGGLISMTYIREQEVVGWQRHPMGAAMVESLATIPGNGYDELWAIIKRTVNGATVRNVEMLAKICDDNAVTYKANNGLNAFFVDSGITYTGAATTTITGLNHLEGQTVAILADGGVQSPRVVVSGAITLDSPATVVHVGLPYTGVLQPMRLNADMKDGTAQGRLKKIHNATVRVYRSGPFKTGRDEQNLDVMLDRDRVITIGAPYDLFTGDVPVGYDGSWESTARLMIVQDMPMPLTVVAVMTEVSLS